MPAATTKLFGLLIIFAICDQIDQPQDLIVNLAPRWLTAEEIGDIFDELMGEEPAKPARDTRARRYPTTSEVAKSAAENAAAVPSPSACLVPWGSWGAHLAISENSQARQRPSDEPFRLFGRAKKNAGILPQFCLGLFQRLLPRL